MRLSRSNQKLARLKRRLVRHHLVIAGGSGGVVAVLYVILRSDAAVERLSLATAYVSLTLLAGTLLIGPVRLLRGRRAPLSSDLRRDVGIWAAVTALIHTVLGSQVHFGGDIAQYFVQVQMGELERGSWFAPRFDGFGMANYTGLAGVLIALLLLSLSSDRAISTLGARRWKTLQRLNYLLFGLVIVHGLVYLVLEDRIEAVGWVLALATIIVVLLQSAGLVRRLRADRQ